MGIPRLRRQQAVRERCPLLFDPGYLEGKSQMGKDQG
jgi:hypothetical protein